MFRNPGGFNRSMQHDLIDVLCKCGVYEKRPVSSTAAVPYFFIRESTRRMRTDAGLFLPVVQQLAELASLGACVCSPPQDLRRAQRHFLWVIFFLDALSAALLAQVLAKKLVGIRMQGGHVQHVPLPSGNASILTASCSRRPPLPHNHPDAPLVSVFVVAEGFQRQRQQVRFFFREHGCYLTFRGAMNARTPWRWRSRNAVLNARYARVARISDCRRLRLGVGSNADL
jgi:hypothetical protein